MGKVAVGGQAVLEGVMMRAGGRWSLAVRVPDGTIHVEGHSLPAATTGLWALPVFRGVANLGGSLALGLRALNASVVLANPADAGKAETQGRTAMVLGLVVAVLAFIVLPAGLTRLVADPGTSPVAFGAVDGLLRLAILFAYVFLVGRQPYVQRVFAYHGAEHKSIHAYEAGDELTVGNARKYPREHPRCGTSFLFLVTLVAFLVYLALPTGYLVTGLLGVPTASLLGGLLALLLRVLLLPLVVGLAYEALRFAGAHTENPLARAMAWPGMKLQSLTTAEPDDGMLEVALASLASAIETQD